VVWTTKHGDGTTELKKDAAERKGKAVWEPNGLPIKLAGFPILLGLVFLFSPGLRSFG
jgi:hypothetical protein